MVTASITTLVEALSLLGVVNAVLAHGHEPSTGMEVDAGHGAQSHFVNVTSPSNMTATPSAQSYFAYSDHSALMLAHISIMIVAWVFVLPCGMVQVAKVL